MAFGLPHFSHFGYPVSVYCAGHAGLGLREAGRTDSKAIVEHFLRLDAADCRMRFCASVKESGLQRHVDRLMDSEGFALAGFDGPLWPGPLHRPGPILALAELMIAGGEAELGLSVDASLRRRGVGTYLVQAAAALLAPRGIRRIIAYTLSGNQSFLALSRRAGAEISYGPDEVEIIFDVRRLAGDYICRRVYEHLGAPPGCFVRSPVRADTSATLGKRWLPMRPGHKSRTSGTYRTRMNPASGAHPVPKSSST